MIFCRRHWLHEFIILFPFPFPFSLAAEPRDGGVNAPYGGSSVFSREGGRRREGEGGGEDAPWLHGSSTPVLQCFSAPWLQCFSASVLSSFLDPDDRPTFHQSLLLRVLRRLLLGFQERPSHPFEALSSQLVACSGLPHALYLQKYLWCLRLVPLRAARATRANTSVRSPVGSSGPLDYCRLTPVAAGLWCN